MYRTVVLPIAFLVVFAKGEPARAQSPHDLATIMRDVVISLAEYHRIPVNTVSLDTTRSGRALSSRPSEQRERIMPPALMQQQARAVGFQLVSKNEIGACFVLPGVDLGGARCAIGATGAGIMLHAPVFVDGKAQVSVVYWLKRPDIEFSESGLMLFDFVRSNGAWRLQSRVVENSERRWY